MKHSAKPELDAKTVAGCLVAIILYPVNVWLWGTVTVAYYNWFVLSVFTALPVITVIQAVGLRWFVSIMDVNIPVERPTDTSYSTAERAGISTVCALVAWGFGWALHSWF